jgi:hypothetical protein
MGAVPDVQIKQSIKANDFGRSQHFSAGRIGKEAATASERVIRKKIEQFSCCQP